MMNLDEPQVERFGSHGLSVKHKTLTQFTTGSAYQCRILICEDPDGGFVPYAIRLAGVVSHGETEKEAIRNIAESFAGAIECYSEMGLPIPWELDANLPATGKEYRVLVNV